MAKMLFRFVVTQFSTENGISRESSTSNTKNNKATRKNCSENGGPLSLFGFIPHSNDDSSVGLTE